MKIKTRLWLSLSIIAALLASIYPLPEVLSPWRPEWCLIVICSWCLTYPKPWMIAVTWFIGILLDTMRITPLGVHAFALTAAIMLFLTWQLRIRNQPLWQNMAAFIIISIIYYGLLWLIGSIIGRSTQPYLPWSSLPAGFLFWFCIQFAYQKLSNENRYSYNHS